MQKKIIVLQLELKRAQHQQRLKPSGVDGLSLTWSLVPMDTQIFTCGKPLTWVETSFLFNHIEHLMGHIFAFVQI